MLRRGLGLPLEDEGQTVVIDRADGRQKVLRQVFVRDLDIRHKQAVDALHYAITVLFAECVMRLPACIVTDQPVSR